MEGIQGVWRFSAKVGCQKLVIESKVLYASAMAMVVPAHFSLKVSPSELLHLDMLYTLWTIWVSVFSEGLHGYIPNFDELVGDVIEQFTNVKGRSEVKGLLFFVMGESMGGAVSLEIHLKDPDKWDGVIIPRLCDVCWRVCLGVILVS